LSDFVRAADAREVPVLDLAPLNAGQSLDALAAELDRACRDIGFFYIRNHGIPEHVLDGAFAASRRYFTIPIADRRAHVPDGRFKRGFLPYEDRARGVFLKNTYEIGLDLPLDDPAILAGLPMHAPNWWPPELPWFREAAEAYYDAGLALGKRLLRLLALALDLDPNFFLRFLSKPVVNMPLFHYPPQPASEAAALGTHEHTDFGMLTILAQDPIGGLEVRKRDGEWVGAPYIPGTLVVNIGDLIQRWTNDVYVSTPHRVANRSGRDRYSIPMFINLDYDTPVECIPTCCSPDRPPRHAPTTSGDYLVGRFQAFGIYSEDSAVTTG
jgi:isopenicillin N synthase-like dioxygenase